MSTTEIQDTVALMRMEYAEMPDLKLTFWQARRLWNVSDDVCGHALMALTTSGFLTRTPEGQYIRRTSSPGAAENIRSLVRARSDA
jgi:hypothetical protein